MGHYASTERRWGWLRQSTIRMMPRVSIGGDTVRVRISNACGEGNLEVGEASVGIRDDGPAIVAG